MDWLDQIYKTKSIHIMNANNSASTNKIKGCLLPTGVKNSGNYISELRQIFMVCVIPCPNCGKPTPDKCERKRKK